MTALDALRKVAAMPCRPRASDWPVDCREEWREAMGGTIPEAEQRRRWCARCVAADAVSTLDGTSESLDKARVVEVLTRIERSVPDGWGGCARRIARDLGLTLDAPTSGQGGE